MKKINEKKKVYCLFKLSFDPEKRKKRKEKKRKEEKKKRKKERINKVRG
jgi:hypothetical protein